jgi:zinc protease
MTDTNLLQRLPTHQRRLANGLTVIVREDHSAPVVAVVTHVRAGYFDEPDRLVGISHVLEHMYFKGTERRGAGEIARETKAAGGYLNAGTIYDRTSYYTVLPAASLEQALDIQSDALQRSAIDDDELRKELQVIIQEAKRKLDSPGAVAQETLFETMFDVHRIRRWRIGTESMLQRFTRDDVWQYYRDLYRATNTILVIAGAVEPEHAFSLAERFYGDMPAGEPVRDGGGDEPVRRGFRYRELSGDIMQTYVELGWRTPGTLHDDTPALDVLAVALGQGRASRLYRHVRDAGAVAAISAYNYTPTTIGIFGIGAELDPPDTRRALERAGRVLLDVLNEGFTEAETERARNILEAQVIRRLETAEGQATLIADWQALGDWRMADEYIAAVMTVTPARLHEVARRYLAPDAATLLVYRPRSAPAFLTSPDSGADVEAIGAGEAGADTVAQVRAALFTSTGRSTADEPALAAGGVSAAPPDDGETRGGHGAPALATGRLRPQRVEDGVRFYEVEQAGARIVIKPRRRRRSYRSALYCRGGVLAERDGYGGVDGPDGADVREGHAHTLGRAARRGDRSPGRQHLARCRCRHDRLVHLAAVAPPRPRPRPAARCGAGADLRVEDAERERKITLSDLEQLRDDMYVPDAACVLRRVPGPPVRFRRAAHSSARSGKPTSPR